MMHLYIYIYEKLKLKKSNGGDVRNRLTIENIHTYIENFQSTSFHLFPAKTALVRWLKWDFRVGI